MRTCLFLPLGTAMQGTDARSFCIFGGLKRQKSETVTDPSHHGATELTNSHIAYTGTSGYVR